MDAQMNMVLTDDEVVALASLSTEPTHLVLPTVATDDPDQVSMAVVRGMRSLVVRNLVLEDGPSNDLHLVMTGLFELRDRLDVFVADAALDQRAAAAQLSMHRHTDGWLRHTITSAGVHGLSSVSADDARKELLASLDAADLLPDDQWFVCVSHVVDSRADIVGCGLSSGLVADGSPNDVRVETVADRPLDRARTLVLDAFAGVRCTSAGDQS